jgi:hypothetical protein
MANPYDFTPEAKKVIWERLLNWMPLTCAVCKQNRWQMPDGFATIPLLNNYWTDARKSGLPCVALVCEVCGNTILINLIALGLQHLIGPNLAEMRKRSEEVRKKAEETLKRLG